MREIGKIMRDYTAGGAALEETNAALAEAGAGFCLEPGRNALTEEDLRSTTVGHYPDMANGYGLLDSGTGSMEKVHVTNGVLDHAVNTVLPDGGTSMTAYVHICGKTYEVFGDTLGEAAGKKPAETLPDQMDLSRRTDLAGQTVEQRTKIGKFAVTYDENGYAVRSTRI